MQAFNTGSAGREEWDAVVIGSGFGGSMAAHVLVQAGWRVVMLERGTWVERSARNWHPDEAGMVSRHYSTETPYRVREGRQTSEAGSLFCVGGPSVFYGGAALRYRERDFVPESFHEAAHAAWPFGYDALEPFYARAERLLGVAGDPELDPTDPWRSTSYPARPSPLAPLSVRLADAARRLGLTPSRVPVAIDTRGRCADCDACDGFACPLRAKNDLATRILLPLLAQGLTIRARTVVTRLQARNGRIDAVEAVDADTGTPGRLRARHVILAAGALATPHLLLASGVERWNPAGGAVGRYLMRHLNPVVFGVFPAPTGSGHRFLKQVAIHDFYFGHPWAPGHAKLGAIQQMAVPPMSVVATRIPAWLVSPAAGVLRRSAVLLGIAEDEPQYRNGVVLDRSVSDRFGLPRAEVHHAYSARDRAAGRALDRCARRVLREAGAIGCFSRTTGTFSHALGTVRMGSDSRFAPLDDMGRFRGLENLLVTDGSALPTSAGVNPSLTIAANALRAATALVRHDAAGQEGAGVCEA